MSGIVGIKVPKDSPIARCVSVIRKLEPSMAISEINLKIKNGEYVLICDMVDASGIKKIIKCYEGLSLFDIKPEIYEHDRLCDIQFIRNLNQTYDEIGEEINLRQYINQYRVDHAKYLIVDTDESITDIALSCGFQSIRNFNRVFCRLTGMTPQELRKKGNQ